MTQIVAMPLLNPERKTYAMYDIFAPDACFDVLNAFYNRFFVLILILLVKMRVRELKWLKAMAVVEGCGSG